MIVSSTMELHSYSYKGQEHLEGKEEGTGSHICMKIYWTSLSKISQRKKSIELCSMIETWESCESLTTAVGNLEVFVMKKWKGYMINF